jgi:hypothetical protein
MELSDSLSPASMPMRFLAVLALEIAGTADFVLKRRMPPGG